MTKIIKNIFYLLPFIFFIFFIISFYFSEKNIISTNKSRAIYLSEQSSLQDDLPLLTNDTKDAIVYSDDLEVFKKKKKKYSFWDLLKSN